MLSSLFLVSLLCSNATLLMHVDPLSPCILILHCEITLRHQIFLAYVKRNMSSHCKIGITKLARHRQFPPVDKIIVSSEKSLYSVLQLYVCQISNKLDKKYHIEPIYGVQDFRELVVGH